MKSTPPQLEPPAEGVGPTYPGSRSAALPAVRRQALLLTIGCAVAALLCVLLARHDRVATTALERRRERATQLAADAHAIADLRRLPRQAVETGLPRGSLLEQVNTAMQAAQLPPATLVSTLPQPPRKVPGSEHAEVIHRLVFEEVRLEPLVTCCQGVTGANPALRISGLQLHAGRARDTWNADVSISYWILAPQATVSFRQACGWVRIDRPGVNWGNWGESGRARRLLA